MSADTAIMPIPGPIDPVPVPRGVKPRADGRVELVGRSKEGIRADFEAAGLEPGKDIQIITIDAVKDGMQALADGKINFIVECNPLMGKQLMELAKKVVNGEQVPQRVVTEETTFTQEQAKEVLPSRKY